MPIAYYRAYPHAALARDEAKGTGLPLAWIKGAGHNSNTDRPDEVNALIAQFTGV